MTINNAIIIQPERRLCEVDGRLGYFHCWESYKDYFYGYVMESWSFRMVYNVLTQVVSSSWTTKTENLSSLRKFTRK